MACKTLFASIIREWRRLCSRKIYFAAMIAVPIFTSLLLLSLLNEGLPLKAPAAIVDLDHSSLSRKITRSLNANSLVDLKYTAESFNDAMKMVDRGEIMGFFYIPTDFQKDAIGERTPTISYYSNMAYFVPGTLVFKGFKTMAVTSSGGIVQATLVSTGVSEDIAGTILQPMVVQDHPIGNPWTNYSYYLCTSFLPALLELMVMMVTTFSICSEIKRKSSIGWLDVAGGSIHTAVLGKLIPQTVIFTIVGWFMLALMYFFYDFPLHCGIWLMTLNMTLMVVASQALGLLLSSVFVNLRMALSGASLLGILAFSLAAFSFPVDSMYSSIGIFSWILPARYYYLIYVDQALNDAGLWYSRWYFVGLLAFVAAAPLFLWNLKRACKKPVYLP